MEEKTFWNEEWKELSFDDIRTKARYEISNYGRIKSYAMDPINGKILKGGEIRGYKTFVILDLNTNKSVTKYVHKLVAESFMPKSSDQEIYVIHLDYEKGNNYFKNLKWATKTQKEKHQFSNTAYSRKGIISYSKLTVSDVIRIKKKLKRDKTTRLKMIAKQFGITHTQLNRIRSGENWGHVVID